MKLDLNYGDRKSTRIFFNKNLNIQYTYQQSQLGSGFNQYIFLPSDPDELVDQLKLIVSGKLGGNDNPVLNEQIIAIADKILQYQCSTTPQHQNVVSV